MFSVAFEARLESNHVLAIAQGASDAAATSATSTVFVIAATILVALALRTTARAVASIVAQIARAAVPAGMAALMLLGAFAIVVYVVATQI